MLPDTLAQSAKDELGSYSTSEVATPFKWIDGKTIYRKAFTGVSVTPGSTTNVPHGLSVDTAIQCYGTLVSGSTVPLHAATTNFISVRMDKTNVTVFAGSGTSSATATLVAEYTKN